WGDKEWLHFAVESQNWTLSQFMHGEQGALLCTAKIVETVPWIDAKYYASTQVMDEARHVEVFAKYLDEKLSGHYPINAHLRMLDRFLQQEVWERLGIPVKEAVTLTMQAPERALFQQMLFSKIVPNCKKLGLLDAADGLLRKRFTELGVIAFEDWADTGEEYEQFDEVTKDREAKAKAAAAS